MEIILDTNILRQHWLLNSAEFNNLIDYSAKTWSKIVLPKMVIDELSQLYEIEVTKTFRAAQSNITALNGLMFNRKYLPLDKIDVKKLCCDYETYIKSKLGVFFKELHSDKYWFETSQRWRKLIKPFAPGNNAYNDTIIWLSILDHVKNNPYDEIVFITDNYKDFGNPEGNDLHPYLRKEVNRFNDQFKLYRSLSEFNNQYTNQTSFINEEWLIANIDWHRLDSKALEGVSHIHCGFFFEDCGRRIKNVDIETWEVMRANYNKKVEIFAVQCKSENLCSVFLQLGGVALIYYISNKNKLYPLLTDFSAEVSIDISNNEITAYEDNYYQENTSLVLI